MSFSSSGPQVTNSSTFSKKMTRGLLRSPSLRTHSTTMVARPRIFFDTGLPPLAFEKCLQSGDAHSMPTGRPSVTSTGSTSNTSLM
ncbi:hypothetical protein D3C87_1891410 [compost metagenome]